MMKNKLGLIALVAGLSAPALTLAAPPATTQGTVGATSTGYVFMQVIIPKLIRVDGLADINFGTYNGDGLARTGTSPACVAQNGAGTYGIVATSLNGSFAMTGATALTTIPYTVSWGGTALTYNTNLGVQTPEGTTLAPCTATAGKLSVGITGAALDAADADTYTDTLVLTVTPE